MGISGTYRLMATLIFDEVSTAANSAGATRPQIATLVAS
jgi:hypothetical protein